MEGGWRWTSAACLALDKRGLPGAAGRGGERAGAGALHLMGVLWLPLLLLYWWYMQCGLTGWLGACWQPVRTVRTAAQRTTAVLRTCLPVRGDAPAEQRHSLHGRLLRRAQLLLRGGRGGQAAVEAAGHAVQLCLGGAASVAAAWHVGQHLFEGPATALVHSPQQLGGKALQRGLGGAQRAQRLAG